MSRAAREAAGRRAERVAALFLQLKGYRVLARRFRTPVGEIDMVARRGTRLAFVEVKTRTDASALGDVLTARQRERIARAAEAFLKQRPQEGVAAIGFDLVTVSARYWPSHLRDAWRVGD
ncbi:YraN family protein [Marinivivus vitaminiproducens]|uniref:YraN family protein n=1 Tax=Marinivivus vitaminiproducens TaxID=3035935 RepID=UPI0027A8880E|nr:YraN family protein [Geminicoccaceae bacterium SCSIO 64248]